MMMTNDSLAAKIKKACKNTFIDIGNSAAGNATDSKKGNMPIEPFSWYFWPYEKKAPKRKSK